MIIAIDHFMFGRPVEESIAMFSSMAGRIFERRMSRRFPLVSRIGELALSYLTDGLYPSKNVDSGLKEWASSKKMLDCSFATSTGTKVGFPVATVSEHPSHKFFTNYNGIGKRGADEGKHHEQTILQTLTFGQRKRF